MPTCDLVDVFCDGALSGNPLGVVHGLVKGGDDLSADPSFSRQKSWWASG